MLLSQILNSRFGSERPIARRAVSAAVAGLAVLAGGCNAFAQDPDPTAEISIDYAEPAFPGFDFRVHFAPIPGSSVALVVSVPQGTQSDPDVLSDSELAGAVIIPLVESSPGELTISGFSPVDVSLETLRASGVRLRLAIANNSSGSVQITDPIPLVLTAPTATTTDVAADAGGAISTTADDSNNGTDYNDASGVNTVDPNSSGLLSASTVAASVSATAATSTGSDSSAENQVEALTAGGATSTGSYGSGGGSTSTTSAGGYSNGIGKPGLSPWSLNSHLLRLISTNASFSSHDQPAPIQGSGH